MVANKISTPEAPTESVVLSWKYPDGTVASGHPLSRDQAEHLARVYGGMYPDQTYWLEPARQDSPVVGRVRRRRIQIPQKT